MMIDEAKRVLALEAKAIEAVGERLNSTFNDAVEAILHC